MRPESPEKGSEPKRTRSRTPEAVRVGRDAVSAASDLPDRAGGDSRSFQEEIGFSSPCLAGRTSLPTLGFSAPGL